MLRTALLVLCAAAAASAQQTACSTDSQHKLCIDFGNDWLKESLEQCLAGQAPTTFEGSAVATTVSLQLAASASASASASIGTGLASASAAAAASVNVSTSGVFENVFAFKPKLVSLACTGAKAVFHVNNAVLSELGALKQFAGSATINALLSVSAGVNGTLVLEWAGSALEGLTKDLKTRFSLAKQAIDSKVASWVGLVVSGVQLPALPEIVRFEGNPLHVLSGAETCQITALVPSAADYMGALLSLPGLDAPVPVATASFDPCRLLHVLKNCSDCTVPEVFASFQVPVTELAYKGSVLKDVMLDLQATVATAALPTWSGSASGSLEVLDNVFATASGSFSSAEGITDLSVGFHFEFPAVEVLGDVTFNGDCSDASQVSGNRGAVGVKVFDTVVTGDMTQLACGVWRLTASLDSVVPTLHGVALHNGALDITIAKVAGLPAATGSVTGTASLGAMANGTAAIALSHGDVASFSLSGAVDVGDVVKGDVTLDITSADTVSGSGSVSVSLLNGKTPAFGAMIEFAKVPTHGEVAWAVSGSVASATIRGLDIVDAGLSFAGKKDSNGLVWSGAVNGKVALPLFNKVVAGSAQLVDNAFQQFSAAFSHASTGVAIKGQVVVDNSGLLPSCPNGVSVGGAVVLEVASFAFDGALTACSEPAVKAPAVTFDGKLSAGAPYGGVHLLAGSTAHVVAHTTSGGLAWNGDISGNTELFGSTSTGSLSFADGQLGPLQVNTVFNSAHQIVTGSLSITYDGTLPCATPATGSADLSVHIANADVLDVTGTVVLDVCTGELDFVATKDVAWKGPWGGAASKDIAVELHADGNTGDIGLGLGVRHWTGSVKGSVAVGGFDQDYSIAIDTATGGSVSGAVTFDTAHVYVGAVVDVADGPCHGSGNVIIRNLPFGLPATEAAVTLSMVECGNPSLGWSVDGVLPTVYTLPFDSKVFALNSTNIHVVRSAAGEVLVDLSGVASGLLNLSVSFDAAAVKDTLRVVGGVAHDAKLSLGGFLTVVGGHLEEVKEGIPDVLDALKALAVDATAKVELLFDEKRIQLETMGELFGHAVNAIAVAVPSVNVTGEWVFGLATRAVRTHDLNIALNSSASLLADVVDRLLPKQLDIALGSLQLAGSAGLDVVLSSGKHITIPAGLNLEMVLDAATAAVQDAVDRVSGEIAKQIEAIKDVAGEIKAFANVISATEIDVQAALAGNFTIGDNFAHFGESALTFRVSKDALALGMSSAFAVRVGTAHLAGSGFVHFGAGGLSLNFDAGVRGSASASGVVEFLEQAFGFDGVNLQLPLGIELDLTPTLTPINFALTADLAHIAGATGSAVFGVDFENPWRVGAVAQVSAVNLKDLLLELTRCTACADGLLATVANISIGSGSISLNADLANALSLVLSTNTTVEIPAGIVATMSDLSLWGGVVSVKDAAFALSTDGGLTASFAASPVALGPLRIASAIDSTQGPSVSLTLTPDVHELVIDGQTTIFGSSVAFPLHVTDAGKQASFELDIGSTASVSAQYTMTGYPGSVDFDAAVAGSLSASAEKIVDDATAFLNELQSKANAAFGAAQAALQEQKDAVAAKLAAIDAVKAEWQVELDGWQADIDAKTALINDKVATCFAHEDECKAKWGLSWRCAEAPICWAGVKALEDQRFVSQTQLAAVQTAANAAVAAAKAPLAGLQAALGVKQAVLDAAQALTNSFNRLAVAAGGLLKNVLIIHDISFAAAVSCCVPASATSAHYTGDITVLGASITWDFTTSLSYDAAVSAISKQIQITLSKTWAASIPTICVGIEGLTPECP